MAILSHNQLETIEIGSNGWRVICNDNFNKTLTKYELNNGIDTNIKTTQTIECKTLNVTENATVTQNLNVTQDLGVNGNVNINGTTTSANDINITDETKGLILKDRTTGDLYRLYVDNGSLNIELV